jgi:hypothetical protein
MGIVSILFGIVGFVRGKLRLTHEKILTGTLATFVAGVCTILGLLMIAYIVLMIRWFPEGWGH